MSALAVAGWLPIPGLERYLVSDDGRIRGPSGRVLKLKRHVHGYMLFGVNDGAGRSRNVSVARSVCAAFNGAPVDGQQVDHIDRTRDNDRAPNLRWVTKAENLSHREPSHGSRHHGAKLTERAVQAIRESTLSSTALAGTYDVSRRTIRDARNGSLWRHV